MFARQSRQVLWFAVVPAAWMTAWLYEPFAFDGPVWCLWRRLLDVECLGCGLTRAVCSLAHGRIVEATNLNPLVWCVVTFSASLFACSAFHYTIPQRFRRNHSTPNRPTNSKKNGHVSQ